MSTPKNVRHFLDLSTSHLPEALFARLNAGQVPTGIHFTPHDYGGWLWVPNNPEDPDNTFAEDEENPFPPEILAIQKRARELGCDYINLDADGELDETLPRWEW